ncbi:hypothetical protein B0T16DRAFT_493928 [Cercophora newfieldiana]|uniref:Uncharacterized protein n=1 Tax=Cercophora newfieldiana TaxID=92897 RepID=A0AA39Y8Q2_9PEZI|nr:hypothetical protein B0T16DRAFT_493928 [Cercophora newfieldiana]
MSLPNPNISNGTCYYAENTVTKGNFIPCGNDALQAWPCCAAGSFCLALGDANACWDAKSGNTYVAGCTDPSFGSPNCLHKPPLFHDQEWVAINQACKNLNANSATDGVTNWTGCVVDKNSTELVKLPLAVCTPYCSPTDVLYAGISSLPAYASLPTLSGSSIFWQNNFVPPTTPAPGYTPGTPTGVVGDHPNKGSGGSSGLSTGAKAGIGVGAAVGGIILLAMLTSLLIWRRKRKQQQLQNPHDPNMPPPAGHPYMSTYPPSGGHPSPPNQYNIQAYHQSFGGPPPIGEFPSPHTPVAAYTGYKTELPADQSFPGAMKGHPSPGQEYVEMDNPSDPVPANYLQPHPQPQQTQGRKSGDDGVSAGGGSITPGSPPLSATSTMLAPTPSPMQMQGGGGGSPQMGHAQHLQAGVQHSRSTSSPSYSSRVARQQQEAAGVYHSRSVSSSGVSPGYASTEGGWEAGSYR